MYTEHIPDERITASSWFSSKHLPYYGRLDTNIGHGAWCGAANDVNMYLEIDLEMEHLISSIITQGKYRLSSDQIGDAWVTVFSLSYAAIREKWTYVTDVNTKQPIVSISDPLWVQTVLFCNNCIFGLTTSRTHKRTQAFQGASICLGVMIQSTAGEWELTLYIGINISIWATAHLPVP